MGKINLIRCIALILLTCCFSGLHSFAQSKNLFKVEKINTNEVLLIRETTNDSIVFKYQLNTKNIKFNSSNSNSIICFADMSESSILGLNFVTDKSKFFGLKILDENKVLLFTKKTKVLFKRVKFEEDYLWLPASLIKSNLMEFKFFYSNI